MNMLQDVRQAETEWGQRFAGRREAPLMGLGRLHARISRALNGVACAIEMLAYTAASTVEAVLSQLMPADVRPSGHPTLSRSCVYRG